MATLRLEDFDVSADRGFLCKYEADEVSLPASMKALEQAGDMLPDYTATGACRTFLKQIPELDVSELLSKGTDAQIRKAMVIYSFLVQSWVWGEKTPDAHLPRNLAVPFCQIAKKLGQFPLLPYSGYVLDNWARIDKNGPIKLENIRMLQNFANGIDENWFVMVHVEIECEAGKALAAIPGILDAIEKDDQAAVTQGLKTILSAWLNMNPSMDRMIDYCDPYIYFNRVRPYIHGWANNPGLPEGVFYEGVAEFNGKGQAFRGQTGSQSSIVPTMDALLNIAHKDDPLRQFLNELHAYRPVKHRQFIEAVAQHSTLRDFVLKSGNAEMVELYNNIVQQISKFRSKHLEYAANYINKQSSQVGNDADVGTGGTPFMRYLKKHRDESDDHLLPMPKAHAS